MPNDTLDNVIGYDNPVTLFLSINSRDSMSQKNTMKGVLCALGAYLIWGIAPVYFKSIQEVPAEEMGSADLIAGNNLSLFYRNRFSDK